MSALFLFFLLLLGMKEAAPKCPPLLPEIVIEHDCASKEEGVDVTQEGNVTNINFTSIEAVALATGTTTFNSDGTVCVWTSKSREVKSQANIEHNKRVQECRTINGEF